MRKKKTNTLSRLACLLLTVSLLWLLPACGGGSASPFPPAEETVRAAAEKLVLSSTSDAYDKFLDTAEERKNNG